MKIRGIPFSKDLPLRIDAGEKTMTRRVIRPQPKKNGALWELFGGGWSWDKGKVPLVGGHSMSERNPLGRPGDILWVREAYRLPKVLDERSPMECLDLLKGTAIEKTPITKIGKVTCPDCITKIREIKAVRL